MSRQKIQVLIIDDSPVMRLTLTHILSLAPHLAIRATAAHPIIAAERMGQGKPDVILLELEMAREAIRRNAATEVWPLDQIPGALLKACEHPFLPAVNSLSLKSMP